MVAINHENFTHEIIFTRVNSQNVFAMLASYFARWPSLDSYLHPTDGLLGKSEQTRDTFLAAVSVGPVSDLEILKGGFVGTYTAHRLRVRRAEAAISAVRAKRGKCFLRVLFSNQEALS